MIPATIGFDMDEKEITKSSRQIIILIKVMQKNKVK
jgi:hypothetical protein